MHEFTPRLFGGCGPENAGSRGTDDSLRQGESVVSLYCGVSAFLGVFGKNRIPCEKRAAKENRDQDNRI